MGMSRTMIASARRARYGVGRQLQVITQEGDRLTVDTTFSINRWKSTVRVECEIGHGPQASYDLAGKPVTITPTWDGQILCVDTGSGDHFATSRRFYQGDEMVLELTTPAGSTMRRYF